MSLPIVLSPGLYSIVPGASPNNITSNPDGVKPPLSIVGLIDATDATGSSQYSTGQYVWYKIIEDQIKIGFSGKVYSIVKEQDILFAENTVIPPP